MADETIVLVHALGNGRRVKLARPTCHREMELMETRLRAAFTLFENGKTEELAPQLEALLADHPTSSGVNYLAGLFHAKASRFDLAAQFYDKTVALDPDHINARIMPIFQFPDLTLHGGQKSRDQLLHIIDHLHPQLVQNPNYHLILRYAARYCHLFDRHDRVLEIYRELTRVSNQADDYFEMSANEAVQAVDAHAAYAALQKAMELDPAKYDTAIHRSTLALVPAQTPAVASAKTRAKRVKRVKYPHKRDFHGDMYSLVRDHIASEHKLSPKFITPSTKFFTIGSCFAVNIYRALIENGYDATCMWLADNFNTTFANRHLADWLDQRLDNPDIEQRIRELSIDIDSGLEKHDRDYYIEQIRNADVFIMTLGVAAAFFTPEGEFVMPRPSELHTRALTEQYAFKTSSVAQNVENVKYIIDVIRSLAPQIKIILTVSPVPLHATFEFESAVVADCLSKSVMRVTAHEVVNHCGFKDVYYWPSFEVFRWAGSNAGPLYSSDDDDALHVSKSAVAATIRCFIDIFSDAKAGQH